MINKALFSSDKLDWGTPIEFFKKLDKIFNFELDVCANKHNTKCENFYSLEENSLSQNWNGICWMNPPYGKLINLWLRKASEEANVNAKSVVCLVPSRTDTKWFQESVKKASYVVFLKGRLKFEGSKSSAPFPSALIIFGDINKNQKDELEKLGVGFNC